MKEQITIHSKPYPATSRVCKTLLMLLVLMAAAMGFSSRLQAQDTVHVAAIQKDTDKNTWHALKTVGGVTISYQYVDCGEVEYVQFKLDNSTAAKVTVNWKFRLYKDGAEKAMNQDDAQVKYTVDGNSALTGACFSQYTRLSVFVRESGNMLTVSDIELIDLNVSNQ